ncbi:hypothetical protein Ddye_024552 [Dipteronia dyeriana]|uniref:Uncharacterized protein n=1 Tax=Dipteronia dyeriana TaxID=168575 RepID=A0AAD9TV26_9ROSI|nr:hypothetical protein Ddye_024552 [Dipteronia dyeriana]
MVFEKLGVILSFVNCDPSVNVNVASCSTSSSSASMSDFRPFLFGGIQLSPSSFLYEYDTGTRDVCGTRNHPTNQEVGKWYYERVHNVDDLYPAPGVLNNMLDENDVHEGGYGTNNHTPEQTRPTSITEPSGTTGVADIPTPQRQRFRAGTIGGGVDHAVPPSIVQEGPSRVRAYQFESVMHSFQELQKDFMNFESRIQDRLEIVLDELRDSDQRREEQHAEMIRIIRTYRHIDDQHHTSLGGSLSMPQHARSDPPCMDYDHLLDSAVIRQQTVEVQDHLLMAQQTPKV